MIFFHGRKIIILKVYNNLLLSKTMPALNERELKAISPEE